ncbi:NAD kinase 2, mitochondrial isoform X2 [Vombatus ursinus]|uniref:NAD kinase 2, mitochondrial isoform X2 n=1 Tax=Vombatus ursinus TaxID=29139 RepID=UPI000FFD769B|nr:NAD kinase 2, mitochondrial isoform X2 [Vombatus ursinus]XP_027704730.1 NAD kinase 2, mitochondrial isoform X2 [Vombatus ursinus]
MTCYRGFLLCSCRCVAGSRAAATARRCPLGGVPAESAGPRVGGVGGGGWRHLGHGRHGQARELEGGGGGCPAGGFRPARVVVVAKTTRYEFEQQRYRYAELSEEDLKQLLALKGSSYNGLLERHHIHTRNVEHILDSLRNEGIEVRLVKRREYDEETVRWADAVIAAGGDGTMLLAASKVLDRFKPVIGVNTDPERSEGHLCLPVRYTHSFPEALQKLYRGEFRWLWRQRIRLYLEGTGINPIPVDLHEQQLSLDQHSKALNSTRIHDQMILSSLGAETQKSDGGGYPGMRIRSSGAVEGSEVSGPQLLPVRALNEVFIGESLSSRMSHSWAVAVDSVRRGITTLKGLASYYEISVDDGPWEKQKSSGLNLCTGTGSKAWSYNINRVATQAVEDVLKIAKQQANLDLPLNKELVEKVTNEYNESLLYSPEEPKMLFSIREPIANRIFSSSRQRCFSSKVCVRSRCWDACMVIDGGTSFEFNDGAIASIMINRDDALRTVLLEQ